MHVDDRQDDLDRLFNADADQSSRRHRRPIRAGSTRGPVLAAGSRASPAPILCRSPRGLRLESHQPSGCGSGISTRNSTSSLRSGFHRSQGNFHKTSAFDLARNIGSSTDNCVFGRPSMRSSYQVSEQILSVALDIGNARRDLSAYLLHHLSIDRKTRRRCRRPAEPHLQFLAHDRHSQRPDNLGPTTRQSMATISSDGTTNSRVMQVSVSLRLR